MADDCKSSAISIETPLVSSNIRENQHKCTSKKILLILLILFIICVISTIIGLWISGIFYSDSKTSFDPTTATINDIIEAITRKEDPISCVSIINLYIDRIQKYDKQQNINSMIIINQNVTYEAKRLDTYYQENKKLYGKLHCVPLLIKDNIDIKNIVTSGGTILFNDKNMKSIADAPIFDLMRQEGGILVGKTNLITLSFGLSTSSNEIVGVGECHNPYSSQNRTCFASSGGSAASIASSFGIIGIGTDTHGSIIVPSSGAGIFGIRPSTDLVSFNGIQPLSRCSDVVGPMTTDLVDAAKIMDIIMDIPANVSSDEVLNITKIIKYGYLNEFWQQSVIMKGTSSNYTVSDDVFEIQNEILRVFDSKNITLTANRSNTLIMQMFFDTRPKWQSCMTACISNDWERYLEFHGGYITVDEVINNITNFNILNTSLTMNCSNYYNDYIDSRDILRNIFDDIFDDNDIDVLLVPGNPRPPFKVSNYTAADNIIDYVGIQVQWYVYGDYPAINVPVGFTSPIENDAPLGLPQSIVLVSRNKDFHKLFTAAYWYQESFNNRKLPQSVQ